LLQQTGPPSRLSKFVAQQAARLLSVVGRHAGDDNPLVLKPMTYAYLRRK
jgi:hypothetical protein